MQTFGGRTVISLQQEANLCFAQASAVLLTTAALKDGQMLRKSSVAGFHRLELSAHIFDILHQFREVATINVGQSALLPSSNERLLPALHRQCTFTTRDFSFTARD